MATDIAVVWGLLAILGSRIALSLEIGVHATVAVVRLGLAIQADLMLTETIF
jgi:Na+/H+ antiporter NhaA